MYNTEELRRELCALGHVFRERCDTEVLLHAFAEWGEKCLLRLNGIYAFAVWDAVSRTLFCARDRIGVKPFFWSDYGGNFVFGSEIKAVLTIVPAEVDSRGVSEIFLIGPGRTPGFTAFRHIFELKPGHCLRFSDAGAKIWRYWSLKALPHRENFGETIERTRALIFDSIKRQSVSDVPIGSFLSGGLDSSAIAAVSGVKMTFSVDYADNARFFAAGKFQPDSDAEYIGDMVGAIKSEHFDICLQNPQLADALGEALDARDLPGMADVDSSLLLFCRAVRERVTVALSGECADELFGGYPWYRDQEVLWRREFPWSRLPAYRAGFARRGVLENCDEFSRELYQKTVDGTDFLEEDSPVDRRMREMFMLNFEWFMQTLLMRKDQMSMRSGLEVRVPFCDHRVAEYAYNIPWEYKNYQNREKGLLRYAFDGVLPERVLWRKKSPYPKTQNPEYREIVSNRMRDLLANPNARLFEIADREAIKKLLDSDSKNPWYGQLMTVPQTIAYFLQLARWIGEYDIKFSLDN